MSVQEHDRLPMNIMAGWGVVVSEGSPRRSSAVRGAPLVSRATCSWCRIPESAQKGVHTPFCLSEDIVFFRVSMGGPR